MRRLSQKRRICVKPKANRSSCKPRLAALRARIAYSIYAARRRRGSARRPGGSNERRAAVGVGGRRRGGLGHLLHCNVLQRIARGVARGRCGISRGACVTGVCGEQRRGGLEGERLGVVAGREGGTPACGEAEEQKDAGAHSCLTLASHSANETREISLVGCTTTPSESSGRATTRPRKRTIS